MRALFVAIWLSSFAALCPGQTAALTVAHDDPDGIVSPGQTVRVSASLAFAGGVSFWEIHGSVLASGDAGTASSNVFPYNVPTAPLRIIDPGVPLGGSIRGVRIRSGDQLPLVGFPAQWPWASNPLTVVEYEWTAPQTLGVVSFDWQSDAALPNAWIISPAVSLLGPVSATTTYTGTSLTVVPTPGTLFVGPVAAAALGARRRR